MNKEDLFSKLPRPKETDKILLLTHTDMDAAGAVVILKNLYKNVEVRFCSNGTMDCDILSTVGIQVEPSKYDFIIACDISCSEDTACHLNRVGAKEKFVLLDHHSTALNLNKNSWAVVQPALIDDSYRKSYYGDCDGCSSGTSLMYDYMSYIGRENDYANPDFIREMTHAIAVYDTWDWFNVFGGKENPDNDLPRDLAKLCDALGINFFTDTMYEKSLAKDSPLICETDKMFIKVNQSKMDDYVRRLEHNFYDGELTLEYKTYDVVYTWTGNYLSATFDRMQTLYPDADIYIIDYGLGITIRSNKPDIDVGKIVSWLGGGGHPGAGGFQIPLQTLENNLSSSMRGHLTYYIE